MPRLRHLMVALLMAATAGPRDPAGQLYDLAADLTETTNRFAGKPEVVERLRAEMRRIVAAGRSR